MRSIREFQGITPRAACGLGRSPGCALRPQARGVWPSWVLVEPASPFLLPFAVPPPGSILGLTQLFLWPGWPGFWAGLSAGLGLC